MKIIFPKGEIRGIWRRWHLFWGLQMNMSSSFRWREFNFLITLVVQVYFIII